MFIVTTTVTLCFDNGLQFIPAIVHVDFELAAMKVLKEIFCNVGINCYRFQINTCMIWFNKFLVYSTPVLLSLNTKQERNYETITLSLNMYLFALNF
jgi:hypothetical protein